MCFRCQELELSLNPKRKLCTKLHCYPLNSLRNSVKIKNNHVLGVRITNQLSFLNHFLMSIYALRKSCALHFIVVYLVVLGETIVELNKYVF